MNNKLFLLFIFNLMYAPSEIIQQQQFYKRDLNESAKINDIYSTYISIAMLNEYNIDRTVLKTIFSNLYQSYKPEKITAYYLNTFLQNSSFQEAPSTLYVDPTISYQYNIDGNHFISQNRIIFSTISDALSYIENNTNQSAWTIYVKQGYYNEDLTIPAGYSVTIKGEQIIILGSGRAAEDTKKSITWNITNVPEQATLTLENIWIRNNVTLNYQTSTITDHYINFQNTQIEGTLSQNEPYGTLYATITNSRIDSEFHLPSAILLIGKNLDLGGATASTCKQYGFIKTSNISNGLTFQTALTNQNNEYPTGFFDCNLAGTFTGNNDSFLKINKVSNYYFNKNEALLVNTTKNIVSE